MILSAETVIPKRVLKALWGQGPAEQMTLTLHEPRIPKMWGGAAALEEDSSIPGSDPCQSETRRQGCPRAPDSHPHSAPDAWVGLTGAGHLS